MQYVKIYRLRCSEFCCRKSNQRGRIVPQAVVHKLFYQFFAASQLILLLNCKLRQ